MHCSRISCDLSAVDIASSYDFEYLTRSLLILEGVYYAQASTLTVIRSGAGREEAGERPH